MPFHESRSGHDRDEANSVIDLRSPQERKEERAVRRDQFGERVKSLAQTSLLRMEMIRALFEKTLPVTHQRRTAELTEEVRYWMESLETEKERIRSYRDETGDDTAFETALSATIVALKDAKSTIDFIQSSIERHRQESQAEDLDIPITIEEPVTRTEEPEVTVGLSHPSMQEDLDIPITIEDPDETSEEPEVTVDLSHPSMQSSEDISTEPKPKELIDIPGNLDETRIKYANLHRFARDTEVEISQYLHTRSEQDRLDDRLLNLSQQRVAFEERLRILQSMDRKHEDTSEERELIADAIHLIEDLRYRIHELDRKPKTPKEQLYRIIELKQAEKARLVSIEDKLVSALKKNGIENPELYLLEQASGLGMIRRGIVKLLGRRETVIHKGTLTKLKKEAKDVITEAINAEKQLPPDFSESERTDPILHLTDASDLHDLWQALSHSIQQASEEIRKKEHELGVASNDERERSRADQDRIDRAIRYSTVRTKEELLASLSKEAHAKELTFSPKDYVYILTELKNATTEKKFDKVERLLPTAISMRDEIAGLWIHLENEKGETITEDETIIEKAKKALEAK